MNFSVYWARIILTFLCIVFCTQNCFARFEHTEDSQTQNVTQVTYQERLSLAMDFVAKLKAGINRANKILDPKGKRSEGGRVKNVLPEGEFLLLQPILEKKFFLNGIITGQIYKGGIVLSLMDFADVLQLAINIEQGGQSASGWYIREERSFSLNIAEKEVVTDQGIFTLSDKMFVQDGDIYVPIERLALWFNFEIDIDVSSQILRIKSDEKLPIYKKYERSKGHYVRRDVPDPSRPFGGDAYKMASVPVVDVSTRSRYTK